MLRTLPLFVLFFLSACGGSSDVINEPSPDPKPVLNSAPVANAGENQNVLEHALIHLDASLSTDENNNIVAFSWAQTEGPAVDLRDSRSRVASFNAPETSSTLTLAFQVSVTNGHGLTDTDQAVIVVNPSLIAPVAATEENVIALSGSSVFLSAENSQDPDGEIISYQWRQISGMQVELNNANSSTLNFIAPLTDALLTFEISVTDNDGLSHSVQSSIEVQASHTEKNFSISGKIFMAENSAVDSDINNPQQISNSNNSIVDAQAIANPVTLGGYVNQPLQGKNGSSFFTGDINDIFSVQLFQDQTLTLLVATPEEGDVDLYLLNESAEIIDASLETGYVESLVVPSGAKYFIVANSYSGASNYTLIVGQGNQSAESRTPGNLRLSDSFVVGEIVVEHKNRNAKKTTGTNAFKPGLKMLAGEFGREQLYAINQNSQAQATSRKKTARFHDWKQFASQEDATKWQTLIAIKELRRNPDIKYAEPNFILQKNTVPNDEYYTFQWHYPLINLPQAWDITTGNSDVTVAVIDTGVLLNHPDLIGQFVDGFDFISSPSSANDGDGIDSDPNDPGDSDGTRSSSFHGTHVAGTVAARSNNGEGVSGVAWDVKIMPLRALGVEGGNAYDIAQAVRFAAGLPNDSGTTANPPADVINLSVGGSGFSQASQNVYTAARNAGLIIVASAGNASSSTRSFPAAYEGVISVSAVDAQSALAPYSNFGDSIDLAAPGGNGSRDTNGDGFPDGVLSTVGDATSTGVQFGFGFQNGTSMASPHVAGVFALMRSVNPDISPDAIDLLLLAGELTDDIGATGRDNQFGYGLVNARKAVNAALNIVGSPPELEPLLGANFLSINLGLNDAVELVLNNIGSGVLTINSVISTEPWLSISESELDNTGLGARTIEIDRTGLAEGLYSAKIAVNSNSNDLQIPVIMQVGSIASEETTAFTYVLLINSASKAIEQTRTGLIEEGSLTFEFNTVPEGTYEIYAGSDNDFDNIICDGGEICGAWLTLDQPTGIHLQANTFNLDFPIFFKSTLPSLQSQARGFSATHRP